MEWIVVEKCAEYIVEKVAECLVNLTVRHGQYLFCIKKFNKNLDKTSDELTARRDEIKNRAEQAERRYEKIENHVKKWLNDVEILLDQAKKLKEEVEASNNCCHGYCPSRERYRLCKQIAEKMKEMTKLTNNNEFEPFSHASLPRNESFSYFNSTKKAFNHVMEALHDDNSYIIGLYGMPGAGKTSLAIEVGKKAEELELFDLVISVTVSHKPNIKKIHELWSSLEREKRVLIIVDDVWGGE